MADLSVIGGGAWGTAIASLLSRDGKNVTLYAREKEAVDSINSENINKPFLSGIKLPKTLKATSAIEDILESKYIFITTPSQFFRGQIRQLAKHDISPDTVFVICSKGIEGESLKLMSQIFEEIMDHQFVILSGPTFAVEVGSGITTSASLAAHDVLLAEKLKKIIDRDNFKTHINNDVIGSQICGAIKNVIAIGCGIVKGLGEGENTRAALLTRGFHEIALLAEQIGGKYTTLMEPCGIGDLILTCSSEKSRNFSFGMELAQGKASSEDILSTKIVVVEGVDTSRSLAQLLGKLKLDLPLCIKIHDIIEGNAKPSEILSLV